MQLPAPNDPPLSPDKCMGHGRTLLDVHGIWYTVCPTYWGIMGWRSG
jgi:hypothetical protein